MHLSLWAFFNLPLSKQFSTFRKNCSHSVWHCTLLRRPERRFSALHNFMTAIKMTLDFVFVTPIIYVMCPRRYCNWTMIYVLDHCKYLLLDSRCQPIAASIIWPSFLYVDFLVIIITGPIVSSILAISYLTFSVFSILSRANLFKITGAKLIFPQVTFCYFQIGSTTSKLLVILAQVS